LEAGNRTLLSLVPGMTPLQIGENVRFSIAPERLHYFTAEGQRIQS
jgi:hypothetical protein